MDLGGRGLGQKGQFKFEELFVGGRKVLRRSPEAVAIGNIPGVSI